MNPNVCQHQKPCKKSIRLRYTGIFLGKTPPGGRKPIGWVSGFRYIWFCKCYAKATP